MSGHSVAWRRRRHQKVDQFIAKDAHAAWFQTQVMKGMPRDRQHRLSIALRIVQPVQQMDAARPGSGEADSEASRVLRVPAGGERGGLFVPDLDEANLLLLVAQPLEKAVDAVTGE